MKRTLGSQLARALLCVTALGLLPYSGVSAAPDYAMRSDKALTSMMLDIAAAGDHLVAVGERGHILYSGDNGETWVQAQVPVSTMLTRVFFISSELGWAVGHDGNVLVSRNGGVNWEIQRDGVGAQAQANEERAGRAKVELQQLQEEIKNAPEEEKPALEGTLEEAEHTLEKARKLLDEPVFAPPLMDVWFANEEQGWASGAYGTLLHTSNGGRHWDDWSHKVNNPEELHLNGLAGAPDGTLYLASEWGTVFRSLSNGESWQALETGYEGSFFGVLVNPVSSSVFAYGLRGTVYRSRDGGESWEPLQSRAPASLLGGLSTDNGTLIFVGQGGTVSISQDDGDTFTLLPQPSRAGIHGIAPTVDGRYMVTGDGGSRLLVTDTAAGSGPAPANSEAAQ
jgi:photosystem II stability/assembly factor-like uncharacterized protein